MFNQIATAIIYEIGADDVVNIYRTKKNKDDKPKSIVVSFNLKIKRDKFIAAKSGKRLNTSIFYNTQTNIMNIYINEHLCAPYKKMSLSSKRFCKQK